MGVAMEKQAVLATLPNPLSASEMQTLIAPPPLNSFGLGLKQPDPLDSGL